VAAVVERDGCFLVTRGRPACTWRAVGISRRQGGAGESHEDALRREMRKSWTPTSTCARCVHAAHAYDDRHVTLHFYRCELAGTPRPLLGQEMRWVPRAELRTLGFPPADEELIQILVGP
jgi:8-oxo-dGTP diphosphatase